MNRLFVIGNGFDLHHDLETSYLDFKDYVQERRFDVSYTFYRIIAQQNIEVESELWIDFENSLARIDLGEIIRYSGEVFEYDREPALQKTLNLFSSLAEHLSDDLHDLFTNWITDVVIPKREELICRPLELPKCARFLNFNYTPVLQAVYGIPDSQVLHIHGSLSSPGQMVVGHGLEKATSKDKVFERNNDNYEELYPLLAPDESDRDIEEELDVVVLDYFESTRKPVEAIIHQNTSWFNACQNVDEISVYGHSLGDVDMPYFKHLWNITKKFEPIWNFSFYSMEGRTRVEEVITSLKIPKGAIGKVQKLEEFD